MATKPLRKMLTLQAAVDAVLPLVVLAMLAAAWLYPQILSDTEIHQFQFATTVTAQIENHLTSSKSMVDSIASLRQDPKMTDEIFQQAIDDLVVSSQSLNTAYIVSPDGRVSSVALSYKEGALHHDLLGIDLSYNKLFKKISSHHKAFWSDTFLSVVGGGLSVAYGLPSGNQVVIGEIDLRSLIAYLNKIAIIENQQIFIIDRRGQVIADREGLHTAQQLNLSNLSIVREGLKSSTPLSDTVLFNGREMIGSIVKSELIDWHVLVLTLKKTAFRQMQTTIGIVFSTLLITALLGISIAIYAARKQAERFEAIAAHAKSITDGQEDIEWPTFTVTEFEDLTTDLKHMADSIKEREAYNRVLFAHSPVPLVVFDPITKDCVDGNQAALSILGIEGRSSLIGKTLMDFSRLSHDRDADIKTSADDQFAACLESGFNSFEWAFKNPNGREWHAEVFMSLFPYRGKRLVQLSLLDITQRKKAQEEKDRLQEQFQQSQKIESIGRLAGGVAHDLNNLLSPILGYAEMLQLDLQDGDPRRTSIDEILKASLRARDVVRQLLAFSRKQTMKFRSINLNEVVIRFQTLLRRTIREDIDIQVVPEPTLPLIRGDIGQLEQVLMNMAVNAQDAMPDGGMLTIEVSAVKLDGRYVETQEELSSGRYVLMTVRDTGHGIPQKIKKNIFEPFYTTKAADKGTGLGLATVYGIIKQHKGNISVYSEPGRGTTFRVYLPITDDLSEPIKKDESKIKNLSGNETILLVEDNEPVRIMTSDILKRHGYNVHMAPSGKEALELLDTATGTIHMLLTDVIMPGMNGKDLFEKVSKRCNGIKALYMSGYTDDVIAHQGVMDEGINFIQKPFTTQALAAKVREVLNHD